MPLPIDAVRILSVGFVLIGFFGFFYMRGNSLKSRVMYLLLLFTVIFSAAFGWFAIASLVIRPDSPVYSAGKPVKIEFAVFGMPYSGGVFQYQSGPYSMQKRSGLVIYRLNLSDWEELKTDCQECVFRECIGGGIVERYYGVPKESCKQVSGEPRFWNQTVYSAVMRDCNGKPYTTYAEVPAGLGRYMAEFCYGKAFNFDWSAPRCTPFQNIEPACVETVFWVK